MQIHRACLIGAVLLPTVTLSGRAQTLDAEVDASAREYPVVLTPTRLRQSLADVPASVTIITAEQMRRYGILSVPDALRLVPGMAVTHASGNDFRINYHGSNVLFPRRMNVLVDGISVYRPGLARVDWKELPVAIEDIDRIEITRSPNSAAYGPNSMLAVVNIITKHPSDVEPAMVSATIGSLSSHYLTGRFSANLGETTLRVTVNSEGDSGYDGFSRIPDSHDSTRLKRLNIRSHSRLGSTSSLGLQIALVEGVSEVPFVDAFQRSFPDRHIRDHYLGLNWSTNLSPVHELQIRANYSNHKVRQRWQTCPPAATLLPELFALYAANPLYANTVLAGRVPSGGSAADDALAAAAIASIGRLGIGAREPICSTPNQNLRETRLDLELQDTYVVSERLRFVAGLGWREERGEMQTFLGGTVSNTSQRAFANIEYRPFEWISFNAGGYVEHDDITGASFSPRLAANFHVSPTQTIRAAVSRGTRTPDFFEQRANWTYVAHDARPPLNGSSTVRFYQSAVSPGGLKEERITSREIGYLLRIPRLAALLDVRAFNDSLTDLISEKLQVSSFQPTNRNSVHLRGAELQAAISPSQGWALFLTYAYLNNTDASTILERTQYSRHSGAIGATFLIGNGWRWSFAYYGASGDGAGQNYYGREDLTLSKAFRLEKARVEASLILRRLDRPSITYFRDFGDILESRYEDRFQMFGSMKVSF